MHKTTCLNKAHKILLLISILLFFFPLVGQAVEPCGFDRLHEKLMQTDPVYLEKRLASELHLENFLKIEQLRMDALDTPELYRIPVVVHVMHLGETEGVGSNITDAQINSAITIMNEDFRKMVGTNGDGNGVDVNIEFGLAVRDPANQPHSGIVRFDASGAGSGNSSYADYGLSYGGLGIDEVSLKNLSRWANTRFYNIWIITEINNNGGGSGTTGYAYFPGAPATVDGAVIVNTWFGSTGTASGHNRTATHELGHGFNLYHTFQGDEGGTQCPADDACGSTSDCVADTPPHIRTAYNCPENDVNSCDSPNLLGQVVHNYMDYSSSSCKSEYTQDQTDRMRAIFTSGGSRESLKDSNGLTPVVVPVSNFSVPTPTCAGPITFTDESTDGPTTWSWTFAGGTPSSSTDRNPTITYTAGMYSVSLTATNSVGAGNTETKTSYITVYDVPASPCTPVTQQIGNYDIGVKNVTFNTINHTSDGTSEGYMDFACSQNTNLYSGQSYSLSVTVGSSYEENVQVYIDYNNNGIFTDAGEAVYISSTAASGIHSTTINVPEDSTFDTLLRMRVISDYWGLTNGSCQNPEYGQTEDYGVVIVVPDTTAPTLTSITRKTPAISPTNADLLIFLATFDEDVTNVDTADFSVNSTTTATVTNVSAVTAGTYDVTISGGDLAGFNGVVGIDLAGGQNITDLAGNPLPAGEPATDETYIIDNPIPGDVNDDGILDLADAIIAHQILSGIDLDGITLNLGADVNGDGKIGTEDAIYILQKVANLR